MLPVSASTSKCRWDPEGRKDLHLRSELIYVSLQEAYSAGYGIIVWTGTTYERFFKAGSQDSVEHKLWEEQIKDTPNQVPSVADGIIRLVEVSLAHPDVRPDGLVTLL